MTKKLYLIDGYNFIFRAYYSLPPLTRDDGVQVGAVYGLVNMLSKFIKNNITAGDMIAVVLDSGKKNFRHQLYSEYKANRITPPQDLILQFTIAREAIEALNIQMIESQDEYEADDMLAAYAMHAIQNNTRCVIVSIDKDLMQLIDNNNTICMYDPNRDQIIDYDFVCKKFGLPPEKLQDYLALIGDSSDNIPGISGVGPKTATQLLHNYNSIENLYQNIATLPNNKVKHNLIEYKELAFLSKQLITLRTDSIICRKISDFIYQDIEPTKFLSFCEKQGFTSLLRRFNFSTSKAMTTPETHPTDFSLINITYPDLPIDILIKCHYIGLYIENSQLIISTDRNQNYIINFLENDNNLYKELPTLKAIIDLLSLVLTSPYVTKIGYNIKILYKYNKNITAIYDIATMFYTINTGKKPLTLDKIITKYCNINVIESNIGLYLIPLYHQLRHAIFHDRAMYLYYNIDKPLLKVLALMEKNGIMVDTNILYALEQDFSLHMAQLQQKIYDLTNQEFNLASPKQLSNILFNIMKLPNIKKYSTDSEVLEELTSHGHEVCEYILEWRHYHKLINTYTKGLVQRIGSDGRIHTTFNANLTTTARLSSIDPNLQNIPINSVEGRKIRTAFKARPGYVIISADYSQIELRLLAHIAKISELCLAFRNKQDIHTFTASEIFDIPLDQVNDIQRRHAKSINFGIIYGIGPFSLGKTLKIGTHAASEYIQSYFNRYPGIKEYMESTIDYGTRNGFVKTIFGRKCYIEGLNDKPQIRSFAQRAAINAPLQGSASDIVRKAMVMLPEDISQYMVSQVHDELLFEVPNNIQERAQSQIKHIMSNVAKLDVPLEVSLKVNNSWE